MGARAPRVSVVVPTHARPEGLRRCLDSLVALDFPRETLEVIVVDDGSDRPPVDVIERAARSLDVRLLERSHGGPAAARNAGAVEARGEVLAFLDDDCSAEPGWLEALVGRVSLDPPRAAGGLAVNAVAGNAYSRSSQLLVDYLHGYYNRVPERARFLPSNNLALPRVPFLAIGGFDESFERPAGEDRDLCARWLAAGHELVFVGEAVVHHHHELAMGTFWRQHYNYGRGAYDYRRRARRNGEGGAGREPLSFYFDLVRFPFGRLPLGSASTSSCLLGLTQLANASGYLRRRLRSGAASD